MSNFQNNPVLTNDSVPTSKRISHQPLTIEHHGLHAKIQENGKVLVSGIPVKLPDSEDSEWDEVEIPAPFVFELSSILKATRTVSGDHENRRYTHQPLTVDNYGLTAVIQANGEVKVKSPEKDGEFDEVEIPASLVFKLVTLLKATRRVEYGTTGE